MPVTSLLELVERLLTDGDTAAAFRESPDEFLAEHGLDDLSGADIVDALAIGFDSVAPDLAARLVLPALDGGDASAADALVDLLDAAPAESVLDEADAPVDLDFGLGESVDTESLFGSGDGDGDTGNLLDLDLGLNLDGDAGALDDLDTATFDQGFGSGSGDIDIDHLGDLDDVGDLDELGDGPADLL